MSASTHKKHNPEKSNAKLYTVIGVIVAVLVLALILYNNGVFQPNHSRSTAATVGNQSFTVAQVDYYYNQYFNNTYQMSQTYSQYGISTGYDTALEPDQQYYDEDAGETYADYFRRMALEQVQQLALLIDQANNAGYTLSDEGKASVKAEMKQIDDQLLMYSVQYGGSESYYFASMFGKHMTKGLLQDILTQQTLASEYAQARADQFTFGDDELITYYDENKTDLDSFDYRLCFIPIAEIETETDEEGNEVEPTEEQTVAAMETARDAAEEMLSRLKTGEGFNAVATEYVDESNSENFAANEDHNLYIDTIGSDLTAVYADWLKDADRFPGEYGVVEQEGYGYYVLEFIGRERRDNSYQTVDVASIVIEAETTEAVNEETGETATAPTEEQLEAAYAKAEEVLAQWNLQSSQPSSEGFLALTPTETLADGSPAAALLEEVTRSTYGNEFDTWAFTPGETDLGSTAIVPITDAAGTVIGYRVVYLEAFGQARWAYTAENTLRNNEYTDWYDALLEEYPIVEEAGMQYVGGWGSPADVATEEDAVDGDTGSEDAAEDADTGDDIADTEETDSNTESGDDAAGTDGDTGDENENPDSTDDRESAE